MRKSNQISTAAGGVVRRGRVARKINELRLTAPHSTSPVLPERPRLQTTPRRPATNGRAPGLPSRPDRASNRWRLFLAPEIEGLFADGDAGVANVRPANVLESAMTCQPRTDDF